MLIPGRLCVIAIWELSANGKDSKLHLEWIITAGRTIK